MVRFFRGVTLVLFAILLAPSVLASDSGYRKIDYFKIQADGRLLVRADGDGWENPLGCSNAGTVYIEPGVSAFNRIYDAIQTAFIRNSAVQFSYENHCATAGDNTFPSGRAIQLVNPKPVQAIVSAPTQIAAMCHSDYPSPSCDPATAASLCSAEVCGDAESVAGAMLSGHSCFVDVRGSNCSAEAGDSCALCCACRATD